MIDNFFYVKLEKNYAEIHHIFTEMRLELGINEQLLLLLKSDIVNDLHNDLKRSLKDELVDNYL